MPELARHSIKIRYTGGLADNSELPLYDGSTSIHGLSQALQIATHAYLNDEIVSRATAMRGAKFVLRPLKRGSFLFEIVAIIEAYPAVSATITAVSAPVFYDFVKLAFRKAGGLIVGEPETSYVKKRLEKDEPFFDELAETLEGSLQRAHRPIGSGVEQIHIGRPRSDLLTFDSTSKDWVNTQDENPGIEDFHANVTRFNSVTRNGRMYVDELERIIPFKPGADFPSQQLALLTWSLHGSNVETEKKLKIQARRIKSASGKTKRIVLFDCVRPRATQDQ